ncbi:uncharacterized protein B0T23DRAFT_394194 [Neurospora hispaniola]|uniref:Uncharacterized protein n=1 Tax=Neurospora hispaniola TaxID=588809 RepID=A0AAJ0IE29_9PEZI|nr:hypothetical protein B0T23DRAFT_394194 [Neurospora hispaniola]
MDMKKKKKKNKRQKFWVPLLSNSKLDPIGRMETDTPTAMETPTETDKKKTSVASALGCYAWRTSTFNAKILRHGVEDELSGSVETITSTSPFSYSLGSDTFADFNGAKTQSQTREVSSRDIWFNNVKSFLRWLFIVAGAGAGAGHPAERSRAEETEWTQKTERAEGSGSRTGKVPVFTSVRQSGHPPTPKKFHTCTDHQDLFGGENHFYKSGDDLYPGFSRSAFGRLGGVGFDGSLTGLHHTFFFIVLLGSFFGRGSGREEERYLQPTGGCTAGEWSGCVLPVDITEESGLLSVGVQL